MIQPEQIIKKQKGQLLVEALIAMSIITLVMVGIVHLISRSVGQMRLISDQAIAMNLAAEGLEVAKNILDGNVYQPVPVAWNAGFARGVYEIAYNSTSLGNPLSADFNQCNNAAVRQMANFLDLHPTTGIYSYNQLGARPTLFQRVLCVENVNQHRIRVISKVIWTARQAPGNIRDITLSAEFLGWRQ